MLQVDQVDFTILERIEDRHRVVSNRFGGSQTLAHGPSGGG